MVDYKTKVNNLYLNASFAPKRELRFTSSFIYNKSEAKYDTVNMPDVSELTVNSAGDPDLIYHDVTFTEMHMYSDLSYELIQFSLSAEYALSQAVTISIDGEYADLLDDAEYIYGNESGSIYMIRTGVRIQF